MKLMMILGKLNELLEQAAVINQDIVITSAAQLEYVESLMALDPSEDNTFVDGDGERCKRQYILSGNLTVDATFTTTDNITALIFKLDACCIRQNCNCNCS